MLQVLKFIFENPLHFFGTVILLMVICDGIKGIVRIKIVRTDKEE